MEEKQQDYSQSNTTYDAKVVIKTVVGPILAASATVISGSLMQWSLFFSAYTTDHVYKKRNVILTCFFILGAGRGGVQWFCWFSSWDPRLNCWQLVSPIQSNPSPDWFIYVYPNPTWGKNSGLYCTFWTLSSLDKVLCTSINSQL